ncbi:oocyst wall protein 9 [Cryptosporidium felis]|nr:oocyst wall protein 9 [Cryptosporidium felis]
MYVNPFLLALTFISTTIEICNCNTQNLRKLSMEIRGTSYSDGGSIPTLKPISGSKIYSPQRLPSSFANPKEKSENGVTINELVDRNEDDIQSSKHSFEDIPFSLVHTLRLIVANKIIQSNPILFPLEIELKNQTLCQCRIDFRKIGSSDEKNDGETENEVSDSTKIAKLFSQLGIPDIPPNCEWYNSTKVILNELFPNNRNGDSSFSSNETNHNDQYTSSRSLNSTSFTYLPDEYLEANQTLHIMHELDNGVLNNTDSHQELTEKEDIYNEEQKGKSLLEGENEKEESYEVNVEPNVENDDGLSEKELNEGDNGQNESELERENIVLIRSLDGLLQCIYSLPSGKTPWNENYSKGINGTESIVSSPYWLNYTSLNSSTWNEIDFKNKRSEKEDAQNKTLFSIEGFWDLIRLIPESVLIRLNIKDENTYNMCMSDEDSNELRKLDAIIMGLNISRKEYLLPTFSLLNVQPFNETYCSRPTGSELDIIGICPSNGLNSVYDRSLKSCISVTYTDSVAFCPFNYAHSKLWGSHRGGGGCHVKQRKYIQPIPKCDLPFVFNEPRSTCVVDTYAPGFPGCTEGSIYYDLQRCIMAFQVLKEYSCPEGYVANFEENFFNKDISDIEYRTDILNEANEHFIEYYRPVAQKDPVMTRKVNDSETGIQSKYITKKFLEFGKKVKCVKRLSEQVKYNGIGAPFCQNSTFSLKYDYNHSWMFEKGPRPYCEFKDVQFVDYKCPNGTVSYEVYLSTGNNPPIVYRNEYTNPFDTCIQVMFVPLQPKCTKKDEIPFISVRKPLNYFEKTGIHIVTKEDIENIDKNSLYNPSEVLDNSLPTIEQPYLDSTGDLELGQYLDQNQNFIQEIDSAFQSQEQRANLTNKTNPVIHQQDNDTLSQFSEKNYRNSLTEFILLNQEDISDSDDKNDDGIRRRLVEDYKGKLSNKESKKLLNAPIRLYDAIIGKTEYVVKIICLTITTAKPYLSCPENTVLVPTNTCKMKGYTDFVIECPQGYKLDEEALLLLPEEHFRKAPPRCVSKQSVFTHYYCPPIFPREALRPFIYNMTLLKNIIEQKMDEKKQEDENSIFSPNTTSNGNGTKFENTEVENLIDSNNELDVDSDTQYNNKTAEIDNKKQFNITNIRILMAESFGRTIVPSYRQKMCHEVDLINPMWTMPLLLRKLLKNVKIDEAEK